MFTDTAEQLAELICNNSEIDEVTQLTTLVNGLEVEKETREIIAKYCGWQRILMILLVWEKQHEDAATRLRLFQILKHLGYSVTTLSD